MLKHLALATVGVGALIAASPSNAANVALAMWNSANVGDIVSASGTGNATIGPENLDGITVTLSFANRTTNPNGLTEGNINIDNTTNTTQTLVVIAGANGYLGPSDGFGLSGTILTSLGTSDLMGSFFVDGGNTLNGLSTSVTGLDIGDFDSGTLSGPHSFSFNGSGLDNVLGPYGMAERLTLTLAPGAMIAVQSASMDASAVPEPRTWALMGLGFAAMAFFGFKRKREARYAI
jgi:hypothetical protein